MSANTHLHMPTLGTISGLVQCICCEALKDVPVTQVPPAAGFAHEQVAAERDKVAARAVAVPAAGRV